MPGFLAQSRFAPVVAATIVIAIGAAGARADVFLLTNGGRIEGNWLNPGQQPIRTYEVELPGGGRLYLDAAQVRKAVRCRPAEIEYRRIAPTFADTADRQWELAEWCREHYLREARIVHLRRVIELAPDHEKARHALGFTMRQGRWVTTNEWRKEQGYRYYRGRFRLPQEIALLEERRKIELAEKEWAAKIKRRLDALDSDDAGQAREKLLAIDDPLAVAPIVAIGTRQPRRDVRLLLADVLANIGSPTAWEALIAASLDDSDEEVRAAALKHVVTGEFPGAVKAYVEALHDRRNHRVNHGAVALAALGDRSAIGPLIDALVTRHTIELPGSRAKAAGAMTTTFVSPNSTGTGGAFPLGSGISTGRSGKVLHQDMANQDVLAALVKLTGGVNFSFDQTAWKYWHNAKRQQKATGPLGRGGGS